MNAVTRLNSYFHVLATRLRIAAPTAEELADLKSWIMAYKTPKAPGYPKVKVITQGSNKNKVLVAFGRPIDRETMNLISARLHVRGWFAASDPHLRGALNSKNAYLAWNGNDQLTVFRGTHEATAATGRLTFKTDRPTGRYRSFAHKFTDIKIDGGNCGQISEDRDAKWTVSFMVNREPTKEDPAPFKWIRLSKKFDSLEDAKAILTRDWQKIRDKFDLHRQKD